MELVKQDLPTRPRRQPRRQINQIKLQTNMFPFKIRDKNLKIEQYIFKIEPELPENSRSLSEKIYYSATEKIQNIFGKQLNAKRGNNFYTLVKNQGVIQIDTQYDGVDYIISFQFVKSINLYDIDHKEGTGNQITQILNIQLKKIFKEKLKFIEIDRNSKFYDLSQSKRINQFDLQIWMGLKTSMILAQDQAYTLVDFNSRVLRVQTARDMFYDLCEKYRGNEQKAADEMVGLSVLSTYGNQRIYKITEIDLNQTPLSTFVKNDGTEIRYIDYFESCYSIKIRDKEQPLIKFEDKKTNKIIYLIPELLRMTGLTNDQRMNFKLMQAVADFTKLNAQQRYDYIINTTYKLQHELKQQGFDLETRNTQVNGFRIEAPEIKVGKGRQIQPRFGNFQIRQTQVKNPGHIKNWILIYESRGKYDENDAYSFIKDIQKASEAFGIRIDFPVAELKVKNSSSARDWIDILDRDFRKNGSASIVVSLISRNQQSTHYKALKEYLFKSQGIPHQNIVKDNLKRNRMSVLSNILLQMNVKLNHENWTVAYPSQITEKRIMLVGIDLYHKLINRSNSCLGFVATLNRSFTEFHSEISIKKPGEDTIQEIGVLFKRAINQFFDLNKAFPEVIVVYRDGVGEGQLRQLIDIEINEVKNCFAEISPDYQPQLAYIQMNKKINQRIFQEGQNNNQQRHKEPQSKLQNPDSGTVVADSITSSHFDFYLASQSVRSGTCTPTHYTVAYNTVKDWTEELFWVLTYYQCYNYFNWQGAVKVPAPVQYAHKLAYLVGETFQQNPNKKLNDTLYYL